MIDPASRHGRWVAVLALLFGGIAPVALASRPVAARGWEVSVGGVFGVPRGRVQVRENEIPGTRLDLRRDLGVDRAWTGEIVLRRRLSDGGAAVRIALESYALDGGTTLPADVRFNGATLAEGSRLATRTHFPSFVRATLTGERDLPSVAGSRIRASAGLTFVSLIFRLRGTLAATTAGRETKEDFVTQELPVPLVGISVARPLARRLDAEVSAAAGALPWVSSLRREGGLVQLRQSHLDLGVGVSYALSPRWRVEAGYRRSSFAQRERSGEDDNDISLTLEGARVAASLR